VEVVMKKNLRRYWGMVLVLGPGSVFAGPVSARSASEEMTVYESPYTIRQELITRGWGRNMPETWVSVSKDVKYGDIDLSKGSDVAMMEDRIRDAARENCRELDRLFSPKIFAPVGLGSDSTCVRDATRQALAQWDEIRGIR
jgi:UrcA family protein